jgi:signal peptidase I
MLLKKILKELAEWIIVFATAFILVLILNTAVFATTQVRQSSMKDTLIEGQHLFIEKVSYLFKSPKQGDIIVFLEDKYPKNYMDRIRIFLKDVSEVSVSPESKTNIRLVKRVIGVPGDEIDIRDGKVYVNGDELIENYTKGVTYPREIQFPLKVGEGEYFVLGDNREVSKDSRSFGVIKKSQIEGRAVFRIWPLNKFGTLK